MSKTDEELLNPTISIVSKAAAKTTNEAAAAAAAAAAVEEISFSSSLAAPSCSNKHQPTNTSSTTDRQTPKSQRSTSKRSTSNKSNAKRVYVSDTATSKEHYFDANSLNSNSSHDDNLTSAYALNHKPASNVPPVSNDNIIITTNATTTGASLNISNYNIFNSNNNSNSYVDNVITRDPIVIRGAGNITIFGVCNKFNEQFPSQLNAKLAPEEFRDTIKQINSILNKELENSFKWLVFGSIFCCCTLGCSLLPVIYMNKKAKLSINKLLDMENQRLYLKLGLKWRLAKLKCNSNSLLEYALLIEFLPTLLLYQPD